MDKKYQFIYNVFDAPIIQLDRMSDFESEGCEFESC